MNEQALRYWNVEQLPGDEGAWSFTVGCHESEETYETRESALEALVDLLSEDNQRLMMELDD